MSDSASNTANEPPSVRISWYRSPLERDQLRKFSRRSNTKAFLYTFAYLGLLAATGTTLVLFTGNLPWWAVALLLALHGTIFNFMINGFHELSHNTVFRTKWLNEMFLRIFSFLGWYSFAHFRASHTRHHAYTLHPPDDQEVLLPVKLTRKDFFRRAFIDPVGFFHTLRVNIRTASGRIDGEWFQRIFADGATRPGGARDRRTHIRWSWVLLVGHAAVISVGAITGLWMLPIVITAGRYYGTWLHFLCNATQHVGLSDNVDDFRLCCRTIEINPIVRFLYWQMNYHTEHHMYAAIPFYNLRALHKAVEHDLPPVISGLPATWRHIASILKRQAKDPSYTFVPEIP